MNLSLQDAATHEIGHTILALALGYPVRDVKIIATHRAWGEMRIKAYSWKQLSGIGDVERLVEEKAMIAVAGYLAQCLAEKRRVNCDYHVAEWIIAKECVGNCPKRFDRMLRRTWAILALPENRKAARLMMNALLHSRRLTGAQVQRIFDRTRPKTIAKRGQQSTLWNHLTTLINGLMIPDLLPEKGPSKV